MNRSMGKAALIVIVIAGSAALALWILPGPDVQESGSSAPRADQAPAPTLASEGAPDQGGPLALPADGTPVVEVRSGERIEVRASPGGHVVGELGPKTEFGSPTVLSVQERRGSWIGAPTPLLKNGNLGWVKLDPRQLQVASVDYEIRIDLSERSAKLLRGDRVEQAWKVSVGVPETPTPTGRFAVTDTFLGQLSSVYGCCAVAITARQPSLPPSWPGGDRIAIHGTDGPLGVAISNGCVRSPDRAVRALVETVPLGTPVTIED